MKNLYITRHGQTEWNAAGRLQGISNSPLTEKGIRDAKALAEVLSDVIIDKVISSDLLRAKETAALLIGTRAPIETDPLLREIHMGGWEGRFLKELEKEYPEKYRYFREGHAVFHPPGGESMRDVWDRIAVFLQKIQEDDADTLLVVCHGKTQGLLLAQLLGQDFGEKTRVLPGTALSHFRYENGTYHPVILGNTDHMQENRNQ